jgi:hypothetical protein
MLVRLSVTHFIFFFFLFQNTLSYCGAQVLRDRLLSLKHKSRALRWQSGSPSSGVLESSGELNFFLDHDMVHVSENKVPRKYGEFFIRHINKFQEMSAEIGRI